MQSASRRKVVAKRVQHLQSETVALAGDLARPDAATTFNKADKLLVIRARPQTAGFTRTRNLGFVHFHNRTQSAELIRSLAHGFADTMRKKPRRFECNSQSAV